MTQSEVIKEALDRVGGYRAVAKQLGMTSMGVRMWFTRGKVPAERLVELERITGVSRMQLRPDLFLMPAPEPEIVAPQPKSRKRK